MNERLIKEDQLEYQEEMRAHYKDMLNELSAIMNEQVCDIAYKPPSSSGVHLTDPDTLFAQQYGKEYTKHIVVSAFCGYLYVLSLWHLKILHGRQSVTERPNAF